MTQFSSYLITKQITSIEKKMSTRSDSMDTPDMPFRQVSMGKVVPNFEGDTLEGPISFYDWLGSSWGILFSHPGPFASICTTEMGAMSAMHNVSLKFWQKSIDKVFFIWIFTIHVPFHRNSRKGTAKFSDFVARIWILWKHGLPTSNTTTMWRTLTSTSWRMKIDMSLICLD